MEKDGEPQSENVLQTKDTRIPVRLVLCVDGTWIGPDGISPGTEGNLSTIFRIWCCIKEGEVSDDNGKRWRQDKAYIRGVNDSDSWYGRLLSGAFGDGIEHQIKEVYRICCERASHPEDEIYFFGFSRGAFVVRAVANLLTYMRIPSRTGNTDSFDERYKQMLDIYKDVRSGNDRRRGSIYKYMSTSKPSPKLQYIGVVDTVKAFGDDELYEIGIHPLQHHCRQALAMNETRLAFEPELWSVTEKTAEYEVRTQSKFHSVIEAWFLGSHGDLGGGNSQDGAALYPTQWLLSEAKQLGLILDFSPVTYTSSVFHSQDAIENPLELLFPTFEDSETQAWPSTIKLSNGISVQLWDLSRVHTRKGLEIDIHYHARKWYLPTASREIFREDKLIGYHREANLGAIIHPSAYMLYDRMSQSIEDNINRPFLERFHKFRQEVMPVIQFTTGNDVNPLGDQLDTKFRLLVCGNAGVGKSTLINKLFGSPEMTQESAGEHGVHDINEGISGEGANYIVHDSCGFQAGQQDEVDKVKDFLKARSSSSEFAERLHAILYCVSSRRLRTIESADEEFFKIMNEIDAKIPVIAIATRTDETEALCSDQIEKAFMLERSKASRRQLTAAEWDEVEDRTKLAVEMEKQKIMDGFARLGYRISGPVFTSKDDQESILAVVQAIVDSLNDDTVRTMFVAAQMSSVQLKIDSAIANSIRLYGHAVRTATVPIAFAGLMATTTVTGLIVKDILKIFQLSEHNGDIALHTISNSLMGNYESNGIYVAANLLKVAAVGAVGTGIGVLPGVALGIGSYGLKLSAVPQFGRLLLMCTIDTILIVERIFWRSHIRKVTAQDVQEACESYKSRIDEVHGEVKNALPVWAVWNAFQFKNLSLELSRIVDKYRTRKELPNEQLKLKAE